jgi:hypothetical protein
LPRKNAFPLPPLIFSPGIQVFNLSKKIGPPYKKYELRILEGYVQFAPKWLTKKMNNDALTTANNSPKGGC